MKVLEMFVGMVIFFNLVDLEPGNHLVLMLLSVVYFCAFMFALAWSLGQATKIQAIRMEKE